MRIGIPREIHANEKRVATTPEVAAKLQKMGFSVAIESGAGLGAHFTDDAYRQVGVEIINDAPTLWSTSDIILKVRAPETHPELGVDECDLLREGGTLIGFIWPGQNPKLLERLASRRATVLALDSVPRISRAQKLDALSSMANITGYRAVIEAANRFGRFFTGQTTAAGKVPPATVFVIGAGVAGLAAIGAAGNLGAIVKANDTRPEVGDQVRSMGGEFVEVDYQENGTGVGGYAKVMSEGYQQAQRALFAQQAKAADIIITTALIPGKPAPKLITADMVASMKAGSVIVDLAAEQGGNCELTVPGEVVERHGVTLIGYTDLPSRLAQQSSQLYASNLFHLLEELCRKKDGQIDVNLDDEVIRGATVIKQGSITWPPPPPKISATPKPVAAEKKAEPAAPPPKTSRLKPAVGQAALLALAGLALYGLGTVAPPSFMPHFTIFVLACFIGYMVIWNVTPALHTPLMSVTNAISGIIVIGSLLQISSPRILTVVLAGIATLIATINIAGGFLVTQRMLRMFRK
jgi:H+-translocating NAD(P) transhydrogenase subunit alpha